MLVHTMHYYVCQNMHNGVLAMELEAWWQEYMADHSEFPCLSKGDFQPHDPNHGEAFFRSGNIYFGTDAVKDQVVSLLQVGCKKKRLSHARKFIQNLVEIM